MFQLFRNHYTNRGVIGLKQALGLDSNQPEGLYIIQLAGPVTEPWKNKLQNKGAVLGDYIPDFAFLAQMNPDAVKVVSGLDFVNSVAPFKPDGAGVFWRARGFPTLSERRAP